MAYQRLQSEFETSHHDRVTDFLSHIDEPETEKNKVKSDLKW